MTEPVTITGGCLCGALRYEANRPPLFMGHCYCADCRKASGSGFIPFMGFESDAVRFAGEVRQFRSSSAKGSEAVRNHCPTCGGLVFGGEIGSGTGYTIYAGSLDNPTVFRPQVAIFNKDRPLWVGLPPGVAVHEAMPD